MEVGFKDQYASLEKDLAVERRVSNAKLKEARKNFVFVLLYYNS